LIPRICFPVHEANLTPFPIRFEPVYLRWKGMEKNETGDLFVRSGPGTILLEPESAEEYVRTRFE
jgi:hypothetical protein